jgi:hypothetical protein
MLEAPIPSEQSEHFDVRQMIARVLEGQIELSDTRALLGVRETVDQYMGAAERKAWEKALISASAYERTAASDAYRDNKESWELLYPGKWAMIRNGKVADIQDSFEELEAGDCIYGADSGPYGVAIEIEDPNANPTYTQHFLPKPGSGYRSYFTDYSEALAFDIKPVMRALLGDEVDDPVEQLKRVTTEVVKTWENNIVRVRASYEWVRPNRSSMVQSFPTIDVMVLHPREHGEIQQFTHVQFAQTPEGLLRLEQHAQPYLGTGGETMDLGFLFKSIGYELKEDE